ncbi:transcriptional regulator [Breznakiella homolactica]|uniref:Transcriptional regulator n=1 Tax=Breznakiella homolactica TaxID=2798577 RepID=A0A7T8B9R6_9SPIR|nr:transcriptional regulator [Breznakiella homolactica]QQO08586.1 transcriptional regulator [Breznakiella homolactica]
MSDTYKMQAADDFSKARGKALLSKIQNFMNTDKDKLLSFNDVKEILQPKNETYKGMQVVPINLIVGSEGRYRDFNKYFLPKSEHLRSRWERVDVAHLKDIILPPIQLYEIGGVYFVRDGNHRVSVARAQGIGAIDAEVVSLSSEVKIKPGMTTDELRGAVIEYEKKLFYEKTNFGKLTDCYDLDFSVPGRYDVIYNHILVHKYYLNENSNIEIEFSDALVSWYNNVYDPIIEIIRDERLYYNFPDRTPSDLYVWIAKHWDFLKKKYGVNYSIADAAMDFSRKYGRKPSNVFDYIILFFSKLFRRKK